MLTRAVMTYLPNPDSNQLKDEVTRCVTDPGHTQGDGTRIAPSLQEVHLATGLKWKLGKPKEKPMWHLVFSSISALAFQDEQGTWNRRKKKRNHRCAAEELSALLPQDIFRSRLKGFLWKKHLFCYKCSFFAVPERVYTHFSNSVTNRHLYNQCYTTFYFGVICIHWDWIQQDLETSIYVLFSLQGWCVIQGWYYWPSDVPSSNSSGPTNAPCQH